MGGVQNQYARDRLLAMRLLLAQAREGNTCALHLNAILFRQHRLDSISEVAA